MFRSVLVPIDGSAHAKKALAEAVDLVQATGAEPHGDDERTPTPSRGRVTAPSAAGDIQALIAESEQGFRTLLEEAVAALPEALGAKKVVGYGPAGPAIVEQVDAGGHDLIVMGSRGRGDVASLLLGSVSHHVVHSTRAAVLIVHAS